MGSVGKVIKDAVSSARDEIKESCAPFMKRKVSSYSDTKEVSRDVFQFLKSFGSQFTKKRNCDFDAVSLFNSDYIPTTNFNDDVIIGDKPSLDAPQLDLFRLCFVVDLLCLKAEEKSYLSSKAEVASIDEKTKVCHAKKIEALHKAIKMEKQSYRWGIMQKTTGWVASMTGIILGATLIATGAGAVAGSLIMAAGVVTLTMSVMEVFGVWQKVTDLLPGDDPEKKRAVTMWIQLGVAVFCLGAGVVGMIFGGGLSSVQESMGAVMQVFGGIATCAGGVGTLGRGVSDYRFKNKLADSKGFELQLELMQNEREDLLDLLENGVERLEKFYEMMGSTLKLYKKVFYAQESAR